MAASPSPERLCALEPQCLRQFIDPDFQGPKIYIDPREFEAKISEYIRKNDPPLRRGFASFCHHLIVENFAYLKRSYMRITPENESQLRTKYEASTPQDLPVLTRYFPYEKVRDQATKQAKYVDIILYTRAEIHHQNIARGMSHLNRDDDPPYGIVRVKAQDVDHELPMLPSRMIRNALGKEYGGTGTALDVEKHKEAVAFWSVYASIK